MEIPAAFDVRDEAKHDGCLVVEGKRLWVNKTFLGMHSPVLAAKFATSRGAEVWLGGKSLEEVVELLQCLVPSPGVRKVDQHNVEQILRLASEWDIRVLIDACQKVVADALARVMRQSQEPPPPPNTPMLMDALASMQSAYHHSDGPPSPVWNQQLAKDAALRAISLPNANRPSAGPFSHFYDKPLPKYLTQPWPEVPSVLQRPGPRRLAPVMGIRSTSPLAASLGPNGAPSKASPVSVLSAFGAFGNEPGHFSSPHGFCLNPTDNSIAVADTNNHRIQIFELNGDVRAVFGEAGREEGMLWYPRKVVVNALRGNEYVVCDRGAERSRMQLFDRLGRFVKKIPIRFVDIVAGLAIDPDGDIVIVDSVSPSVFVVCPKEGTLATWFDISAEMKEPSDLACFRSDYFICDFKGHAVCVFGKEGSFKRRICLDAYTSFPNGVDISAEGDILVVDSHGNRLHLTVFRNDGAFLAEFDSPNLKVSRCCGLRMTLTGQLVTLAKNNHQIIVLDTLTVAENNNNNHNPMSLDSPYRRAQTQLPYEGQTFTSPLLSAINRTPINNRSINYNNVLPSPPDS